VNALISRHDWLATSPRSPESKHTRMLEKININTATTRELTQLPGIAKNLAYRIVNHRDRHGFFTHWEELAEVKEFPMNNLDRIKQHATLETAPDVDPSARPPLTTAEVTPLTNPDSTSSGITGIAITGTDAGDFAQTRTCGSSFATGMNYTISVAFKPTATRGSTECQQRRR
jgi:competence ComEA-like helix-hairpin-helix protein